jgi:hypothetical protein
MIKNVDGRYVVDSDGDIEIVVNTTLKNKAVATELYMYWFKYYGFSNLEDITKNVEEFKAKDEYKKIVKQKHQQLGQWSIEKVVFGYQYGYLPSW